MKRCNHQFCLLLAEATSKTCWLESEDIPDPVKLLRAISEDPGSIVLSGTVLVEVEKFLRKVSKLAEINLRHPVIVGEEIDEDNDITAEIDATAYQNYLNSEDADIVTCSDEGEA